MQHITTTIVYWYWSQTYYQGRNGGTVCQKLAVAALTIFKVIYVNCLQGLIIDLNRKHQNDQNNRQPCTPIRTLSISGLKSGVLKLSFFSLKMTVKSGLKFILKFTEPLQRYLLSCQAKLTILGRQFCTGQQQLSRGSVNFKINSRPLFTIILKLKNDNFKTRDFSPLIERVLIGVNSHNIYC